MNIYDHNIVDIIVGSYGNELRGWSHKDFIFQRTKYKPKTFHDSKQMIVRTYFKLNII